jgi:hypothetical protein
MLNLDQFDKLLHPLHFAFHNTPCATYPFEETKKDQIMSEIFDWANDLHSAHDCTPVLLLHDDSRSAVTTIAHRLMEEAQKDNRLLALYFILWNGESKQCDPTNLIPTIMYQVALFDRFFLNRIANTLVVD